MSSYGTTVGQQRAADAAKVALEAGKGAAAAAGMVATVNGLLVAAGAAQTAPIVGQIAGAGMAAAAGIIALTMAVRSGKARRDGAVALAAQLGIADANASPAFITRLLKLNPTGLKNLRKRYAKKAEKKDWWETNRGFAKRKKKLALIAATELTQRAQAQGNLPAADTVALEAAYEPWFAPGTTSYNLALGGTAFLLTFGGTVTLRRSSRRRNPG